MIHTTHQRFLLNKDKAGRFHEVINSSEVREGLEACLLTFLDRLPAMTNQLDVMGNAYRMEGARMFKEQLLNYCEPPAPRNNRDDGNLKNNVR